MSSNLSTHPRAEAVEATATRARGRSLVATLFALTVGLAGVLANAGPSGAAHSAKVTAWGQNTSGQAEVPSNLGDVTDIAAGWSHNLAVRSDGTVVAWGANDEGQTDVPHDLRDVAAVAAGYGHSLALKSNGTVTAWGLGALGRTDVPTGLATVTAITAGYGHNLALKADGTVVGWGYNNSGQATAPAGLTDVVAVEAHYLSSLALRADGTVVAWGNLNARNDTVPADLGHVTALAAGNSHALALRTDGTVVGWGDNTQGQISVPADLRDVVSIAAGDHHSLALTRSGTVVAWGDNMHGESSVPAGLDGADEIAANGSHNVSLDLRPNRQEISWTMAGSRAAGTTAALSGTATSGLPVSYRLAATTRPGTCRITGTTLHLQRAGSCTVHADQAGDADHARAPRITRTITVVEPPSVSLASARVARGEVLAITVAHAPGRPYTVRFLGDVVAKGEVGSSGTVTVRVRVPQRATLGERDVRVELAAPQRALTAQVTVTR